MLIRWPNGSNWKVEIKEIKSISTRNGLAVKPKQEGNLRLKNLVLQRILDQYGPVLLGVCLCICALLY